MSTHNIGFYAEISKIITQISSNMHLISTAAIIYLESGSVQQRTADQAM